MNRMKSLFLMLMIFALSMIITGCKSAVVPPGTTVIVVEADGGSDVKTEGSYYAWGRDRVYFIDTKLKSFTEKMQILCEDNINMSVDVKWLGSFNASKEYVKIIKQKVPARAVDTGDQKGYQLSLDDFYNTAMKDIVRAYSRGVVNKYNTDNVRAERAVIEAEIKKKVIERFESLGYPILTTDVMVSNLDYPDEITAQRKAIKNAQLDDEKNAALAKARLSAASREEEIAAAEGKATVIKAMAEAQANNKLSASLTSGILMARQIEMMEKIATNPNKDMIIMPYAAMDGSGINQSLMKRVADKQ